MSGATRFVAVVRPPSGPLRFCAHIHRRRDNAELCARRCALRIPGATAEVADAWDPEVSPCVMRDYHQQGRPCPACGFEG